MGFEQEINRFDANEMERQHKRAMDEAYRRDQNQREKQAFRRDSLFAIIRLLTAGLVLFIIVLAADGLRREGDDLRVNLSRIKGGVDVQRRSMDGVINAHEGMKLVSEEKLETKARGAAALVFPEGSVLRLDNNTRFEVRQLDFYRPNTRNRSFRLSGGSVLCRMSPRYGKNGQLIISTNSAIIAARRGGFSVRSGSNSVQVDVVDGLVVLKNGNGRLELTAGMRGIATGDSDPTLSTLDPTVKRELATQLTHLRSFDNPSFVDGLVPMERGLMGFLNPVLQKIGVVSGGWSIADNDDARRLEAATQLKNIAKAMEDAGGAPGVLSLGTLTELGMDAGERDRAILAFAGATLDGYERRGSNAYTIRVRARDSNQTPYILTERGVKQGK